MINIAQILENALANYGIFIVLIFIIFVLVARFIAKLILQFILILVISIIFPIFANKILGFYIPINLETILSFIYLGFITFLLYYALKLIWKLSEIIASTIEYLASLIENFIEKTTTSKRKKTKKKEEENEIKIKIKESNNKKGRKEENESHE